MRALTFKQQRFADSYRGNATAAAREAGYGGSPNTLAQLGRQLLSNARVRAAIEARMEREAANAIVTRQQCREFWSSVMRNETFGVWDRLHASELLAKSEFIQEAPPQSSRAVAG